MNRPHESDGPRTFAPVVQSPFIPPAEQLVVPYLTDADDQGFSPETIARASGPSAYSPPAEASALVLPPKHYARVNRLLLRLDYANLDVAAESSERWIDDVGICAGKEDWGFEVMGEMEMEMERERNGDGGEIGGMGPEGKGVGEAKTLDMELMRKKKRGAEGDGPLGAGENGINGAGESVNVLATGLVRKKPKVK